ncbi:unnamed protein product [Strongylus vulgaris]|uniref:Uncharacterized protein n=1 Tax=Strongylus vulgaris TaxID=40348 RepID=A0A3P7IR19_STRVU|nr:unnamed protein product [Strongylus vulgaris]
MSRSTDIEEESQSTKSEDSCCGNDVVVKKHPSERAGFRAAMVPDAAALSQAVLRSATDRAMSPKPESSGNSSSLSSPGPSSSRGAADSDSPPPLPHRMSRLVDPTSIRVKQDRRTLLLPLLGIKFNLLVFIQHHVERLVNPNDEFVRNAAVLKSLPSVPPVLPPKPTPRNAPSANSLVTETETSDENANNRRSVADMARIFNR